MCAVCKTQEWLCRCVFFPTVLFTFGNLNDSCVFCLRKEVVFFCFLFFGCFRCERVNFFAWYDAVVWTLGPTGKWWCVSWTFPMKSKGRFTTLNVQELDKHMYPQCFSTLSIHWAHNITFSHGLHSDLHPGENCSALLTALWKSLRHRYAFWMLLETEDKCFESAGVWHRLQCSERVSLIKSRMPWSPVQSVSLLFFSVCFCFCWVDMTFDLLFRTA